MDIQPLNGILNGIGSGDEWDNQRLLQRLITQWNGIVGATVAKHSRPLEIQNGRLQVATSTAVWAQNLSFERRRILKKLNARPDFKLLGLQDIRFSTAQWHSRPGSRGARSIDKRLNSYQQQLQWQQHPSRMPPPEDERSPADPAQSAAQAFERWSRRRQQQVRQVPLCPQCQTPAPQGELQRWGLCAFCMTQQWQAVKEANHPDGSEGEPWHEVTEPLDKAQGESWGDEQSSVDDAIPASRAKMAEMLAREEQRKAGLRSPKPPSKQPLPRKAVGRNSPVNARPGTPPPSQADPGQTIAPMTSQPAKLQDLMESANPGEWSPLAAIAQSSSMVPRSSPAPLGKPSRDPALSGPLAPLSAEPPLLDAVSQDPFALVTRSPEPNMKGAGAQNSGAQQQAAWAQAFQTQKSLEAARQAQQADLERRVASQAQQIARDRIQAQTDLAQTEPAQTGSRATFGEPEGDSTVQDTVQLSSGHTKPVLKQRCQRLDP